MDSVQTPHTSREFDQLLEEGLHLSPVTSVLVEESILGWKEYELEVIRDRVGNGIIVCSIENVDAMGVHTGDSYCTAPMLTIDEALTLFEEATDIHEILGETFCMIFDEVKREEMQLFHREISPWEREHLLLNV